MVRASRIKKKMQGSLKGKSCRDYYYLTNFMRTNVVARARQYLPENIWTKLDRHKPVSQSQADQILDALNRILFEMSQDFPITIPAMECQLEPVYGFKEKRVVKIRGYYILKMKPITTAYGTLYNVCKDEIEYQGQKGIVAFSTHALKRLIERCPTVVEKSRKNTAYGFKMLVKAIQRPHIQPGPSGQPQLKFHDHGWFPISLCVENGTSIWVCETYLARGMDNAADRRLSVKELAALLQL